MAVKLTFGEAVKAVGSVYFAEKVKFRWCKFCRNFDAECSANYTLFEFRIPQNTTGARHRRWMSLQVCSLYWCESGWSRRAMDIHTMSITYSSYRYYCYSSILSRVSTCVFLRWNFVQLNWTFDSLIRPTSHRGGTTQHQGRDVPELGAQRPRLGWIDPGWINSGAYRP